MKHIVVLVLFCLLPVVACLSQVINVPDDFETIREALDNARNGDEIRVAEGIYEENIDFNGLNVRVIGNPDDPTSTIIDGGGNDCVVQFTNDERNLARLDGFTIRNGTARGSGGGGIYCRNASPTLRNLIVTGNSGARGGGILLYDSNSDLTNITVIDNEGADYGGGICLMGSASPNIEDVVIRNNVSSRNRGGGIASFSRGRLNIRNTIIRENEAENDGGGIYSQGTMFLTDVEIDSNETGGTGGGIYTTGNLRMTRGTIIYNTSEEHAGGVYVARSRPILVSVLIAGNQAGINGGGFYIEDESVPELTHVTIADNIACENGGAIYCNDDRQSYPKLAP